MDEKEKLCEQRYSVKFCVKHGTSHVQTMPELTIVYGDEKMLKASIYWWYESFQEGRISILLKRGPSVPCQQTDEIVLNICATFIANNHLCTLEEISQLANISK